jgi:hypothetical protein
MPLVAIMFFFSKISPIPGLLIVIVGSFIFSVESFKFFVAPQSPVISLGFRYVRVLFAFVYIWHQNP